MSTRIYVGGLAKETTEETLKTSFETFGEVLSVEIIKDSITKKPKGFVEMTSSESALKAITTLSGKQLDGQKLTVNQAQLRKERGKTKPQKANTSA